MPLIERLARLKAVTDLGSSMISQLIAIRLLPHLEQILLANSKESMDKAQEVC